ncbi:MAG: histidine phosphatase family protein, partial [Chloroflexota bacterium]|nr:histidine phosphatase family protein [Chloroflexota bacterium]
MRHGESTYNAEGRIQGQQDAPLSERGRRQAERIGE